MKQIKRTKEYTIFQKRSDRYSVKSTEGKWINGEEKTKILLKEKLIKAPEVKKAAVEASPTEAGSEDNSAVAADENKAEEAPAAE